MGTQRLNPKSTRRIARSTGLDVVRAWGHGGYVMSFVTADHKHGAWDKKTGRWELEDDDHGQVMHFSTCRELFPDWVPPRPPHWPADAPWPPPERPAPPAA